MDENIIAEINKNIPKKYSVNIPLKLMISELKTADKTIGNRGIVTFYTKNVKENVTVESEIRVDGFNIPRNHLKYPVYKQLLLHRYLDGCVDPDTQEIRVDGISTKGQLALAAKYRQQNHIWVLIGVGLSLLSIILTFIQ